MLRSAARELLDDEPADAERGEWRGSLRDLDRINAWLGGRRLVRIEIDRLPDPPRSLLDVGTGSADLAVFAVDHLRSRGVAAKCVAIDRSATMLSIAAERLRGRDDIELAAADASALPFRAKSFDVALMTLALHHFDETQAVSVLRELARVAHRVIINDLRRSAFAWAFARLCFPLLTRNRLTLHDAPISVLRAYTPDEARRLAAAAGWDTIAVRRHAAFRMALVGGAA